MKVPRTILIFAAMIACVSAHADSCSIDPKNVLISESMIDALSRPARKLSVTDVHEFCRESAIADGLKTLTSYWASSSSPSLLPKLIKRIEQPTPDQQFSKKVESEYTKMLGSPGAKFAAIDPWSLQLIPIEDARKELLFQNATLHDFGFSSISEIKQVLLGKPHKALNSGTLTFQDVEKAETMGDPGILKSGVACVGRYPITKIKHCIDGVETIAHWMAPHMVYGGTAYSLVPETRDLILDPKNGAALGKAALKIIDQAEQGRRQNSNIFQDIYQSFVESGFDRKKSYDLTWTTLAVISTGGANIGDRLASLRLPPNADQAKTALTVIAAGASLLDMKQEANGRLYSFPPGVLTNCDTGKAYHFWMSAYFARRYAIEKNDPRIAATAAYILEMGYQMLAKVGSYRDPINPFIIDTFSPYNNIIRTDLAFGAAGAWFGAQSLKTLYSGDLNVDQAIRENVESAPIVPKLTQKEATELWSGLGYSGYKRWSQTFMPDATFKYFEKDSGK